MALPTSYSWTLGPPEPPTPPDPPAVPDPGDATVLEVNVKASDTIEVVFNQPMANNAALALETNYVVIEDDEGVPVTVRDVIVSSEPTTANVRLVITPFTVGATYSVIVSNNISNSLGDSLSEFNSAPFIGRHTKTDSVIQKMPGIYDTSARSLLRALFNAITEADDAIGGSRQDNLVGEQIATFPGE